MMARQAACRTAAVEPSALGRKRARTTHVGLGVRRVVFAVGEMSSSARRRLAARFRSELAGVRALLKKAAEFLAPDAGKSGRVTSPSGGKDGRFLVAGLRSGGAPLEDGRNKSVEKRKASCLSELAGAPMMTPDGRKRLAARQASHSAELPAQIGELLQRNRHGSSGKAEIEVQSMDDAALFELKQQLDKCTEETRNHGNEPMDASAVIHPSPSPRRRQAEGKIGVEEDEDVDICGGASPLTTALSPLFPDVDYSELVGATGVNLLSPLQRKYIALAERADVCGGAASTVAPALSSLLPPAGYSELVGATGVNLLSPLPRKHVALAERVDLCGVVSPTATTLPSLLPEYSELADTSGVKMPPLPRKHVALAERVEVCGGVASTATTLPSLPPPGYSELADATGVNMLSPLPHKYVALATEDDEYVDICGDASPVVIQKNHGEIIINSSSPSSSSRSDCDSDSGSGSSSDDSDSDASAAGSTPAPAIPTNVCVSSAQPSEPAAREVAVQSEKQDAKLPDQHAAAPSPKPLTDLIARAQGAVARRRQEEKTQAREKARQELLEMERTAMASNAIHPLDMKLLGLAAVEYMVSSDEEVRRTLSFDSTALRSAAPSCLSLLEKLGLFLKTDDASLHLEEHRQVSTVRTTPGSELDVVAMCSGGGEDRRQSAIDAVCELPDARDERKARGPVGRS
ncbi:hypothetical protein E2562_011042 [Oryza meyeriana var. granulata]|uniref:NET domain-containing protein n=1 Tax=Oryza meyeriana var. granulata TaxID=110450 RepID=A0A6G1EWE2_9ORYZ|nr:hypothetical protein E2562_011042 [Oryza meyeriana var. granulata]